MTKLATLTGHTLRVLYLAVSPDGQTIVTGAGQPHGMPCLAHAVRCRSVEVKPAFALLFVQHIAACVFASGTPISHISLCWCLRCAAVGLQQLLLACLTAGSDLLLGCGPGYAVSSSLASASVQCMSVLPAGDETLRFWNVFPGPKSQGSVNDSSVGSMMRTLIR